MKRPASKLKKFKVTGKSVLRWSVEIEARNEEDAGEIIGAMGISEFNIEDEEYDDVEFHQLSP